MDKFQSSEHYQQIEQKVVKNYTQHDMNQLLPFTRKLFSLLPEEEYLNTPLEDLSGFVGNTWDFFQNFDGSEPKIRVFNPTLEEDGWLSQHSVIYILQKDMPFLVDSLRIELNNRGINIHVSKSAIFRVKRDSGNNFVELAPNEQKSSEQDANEEVLMIFLVDLHSSQAELSSVANGLKEVLADVDSVVSDFQPMLGRIEQLIEETAQIKSGVSVQEREDAVELLKWMHSGYFTFLGCSEYNLRTDDGVQIVAEQEDQRLGLFKLHGTSQTSAELESLNPGYQSVL